MATQQGAKSASSTARKNNDIEMFVVLGIIVGLVVFWPRITEWAQTKLASSGLGGILPMVMPIIAAGLVIVGVFVVYRLIIGARRRKKRDMIRAVLAEFLPRSWQADRGVLVTWLVLRAVPKRVSINYPSESLDRDPKWRAELADLAAYRAGMEAYKTAWDAGRLRLTVTRKKPEPERQLTEEEQNRSTIFVRTHQVISTLFTGEIKLTIPAWSAEAGDPAGGYPLEIGIRYEPTTRDTSPQWRRRLEAVTALKVPPGNARWVAQYKTAADEIVLKHRPPLPTSLSHPGPSLWAGNDGIVLPYACDENGRLAAWAITGKASKMRPTIHTLIIGPTGTGKTSVMRSLLVAATGQGVLVIACDPKRIELTPFRGWPGVLAVGSTEEDMGMVIKAAYELMMARYTLIEAGQADADDMTPVLLFLDELLILQARLNRWWGQHKGDDGVAEIWGTKTGTAHPAMGLVAELLALARSANIRVVEGVQRPDAELFEKGARDNLRHRISLGRLSQQGAEMLWGDAYTGTDTPMISGRAVASPDGTSPLEVQMYWTPDPRARKPEDAALMAELRAVAEEAIANTGLPEGLDLSAVSDMAKQVPEGDAESAEAGIVSEVTDHTAQLSTQTVGAAALVVGDRILDEDGQVWDVAEAEESENPDDPDLWDFMRLTFTSQGGRKFADSPAEATYERIIDAAM